MSYREANRPLHSRALELEPPPPSTDELFWTTCCASLFGLLMLAYMSYPDNPSFSNPFVSLFMLCFFLTWISHLVVEYRLKWNWHLLSHRPDPPYPVRDWFIWKAFCFTVANWLSALCGLCWLLGRDVPFLTPTTTLWCLYFFSTVGMFCDVSIAEEVRSGYF
ncbi:hypothetical protein ACE6H2_020769 [Prunus campanulata]